jgi:hypothetical protein
LLTKSKSLLQKLSTSQDDDDTIDEDFQRQMLADIRELRDTSQEHEEDPLLNTIVNDAKRLKSLAKVKIPKLSIRTLYKKEIT